MHHILLATLVVNGTITLTEARNAQHQLAGMPIPSSVDTAVRQICDVLHRPYPPELTAPPAIALVPNDANPGF